eukprot:TRINITY_DN2348_c0_g1_i12.p1 TRINITY_DN2348_c0_g1~~TRINITY_DN2348_c0_g1_i12.p1  ORF type:complete len:270 (+),score=34.10 TRINITY_DN2348_c0_g1_i12:129-938(+)
MSGEWFYAGACHGHTKQVRVVVTLPENRFATGSSDGSVKIWKRSEDVSSFLNLTTLRGHEDVIGGVSALCFIPPGVLGGEFSGGALVSGAYDGKILLWGRDCWTRHKTTPSLILTGHTKEITSLSCTKEGFVLSGSGDNTAILWDTLSGVPIQHFVGHVYPIWGVASLDNANIVTVSGDRSIKVWDSKSGILLINVNDNQDCVRSVTNVPGLGFVTSSNDGSVRLYTYSGELLEKADYHDGPVYSVVLGSNGALLTASEDATVKIWKGR